MDGGGDGHSSWPSVLRAVLLLLPVRGFGDQDAHDVVQEAYARALVRWPAVSRLDDPEAWVRRVAVDAALHQTRRERSRRSAYRLLFGRPASTAAVDAESTDVVRALQTLPPAQRRAVVLHHLLDLSVAQIAAETGRPVGAVEADLSLGRAALALVLGPAGEAALDV